MKFSSLYQHITPQIIDYVLGGLILGLITWIASKLVNNFIKAFKLKKNMQKQLRDLSEYIALYPWLRTNATDYQRLKAIKESPFFENILVYLSCPIKISKSKTVLNRLTPDWNDIAANTPCFLVVDLLRVWNIHPWRPK